ncbi:ABC transporter permease [Amycolatopsis magusensis]|uniref:ABC transport system permease protein n=1 Tax=Amycolatopsis magusensis TaxID=882444 RepID=A0ABS4PVF3_9PSEU|nr:FtsX-like permease family protein [Amycolatopsis magusensis]MBP2183407.1 putative ABC transport system permease protein [Amycolatopsis magusensis]
MFSLAWQSIRNRRGAFAAAFVAVFFGSALITASGVLLESGLRAGMPPQRYATAPVVVTAIQSVPTPDGLSQRFGERVPLRAGLTEEIARVPGVQAAIGDVSVDVALRHGGGTVPLSAHGWSSTKLGPATVDSGRAPAAADEVVLDGGAAAQAGLRVGDHTELEIGAVATTYRVVGTTAPGQAAAFLTDEQARVLSGRPDQVDAVAVLADPGTDADALADRVQQAVPEVTTAVGDDRAEAEFLDVGAARQFLVVMSTAFGGTMLMIVLLVVASTLGLAIQQRRREFALLRAVAATPRQVYRLIATESLVLAAVASVLGAVPGIGLSLLLRDALAGYGAVPAEFRFAIGGLPVLASVLLCLLGALGAGLIAGRRAARISPAAALGEAAVEPPRLGRVRLISGWVLAALGATTGIGLPMVLSGNTAVAGAASSALLLVIAVALLGPRLLTATAGLLEKLGVLRSTAGYLAGANTRARSRRLGSAATPLIMGVALASVQVFTATTTNAAAQDQAVNGIRADHVIVADGGIAPSVVDSVRQLPGVDSATPVARTSVLVTHQELGEPATNSYPAQGVTPDRLGDVLDLDPRQGDLSALTGETVALSELAADSFGVEIGSPLSMRLGDGTPHTAEVVAIYGNGLGFGDVTLPNDVVLAHTGSRLNDELLLATAPGTDPAALREALPPGLRLTDRASFTAAQNTEATAQSAVNLLLNLLLLGFIAIAVVNILVLATAARVREFALLRLIGAKPRQVRSMMRGEAAVVVVAAVVLGSLAALPPLIGVSLSLTASPLPTVPPLVYLGIVGAAAAFGWGSIAIPARIALRPAPVAAMRVSG